MRILLVAHPVEISTQRMCQEFRFDVVFYLSRQQLESLWKYTWKDFSLEAANFYPLKAH